MNKLTLLKHEIKNQTNQARAEISRGFFKTKPGQYGAGDKFLGLTVPQSRVLAKKYKDLSFNNTSQLLQSKFHEERLIALFILIYNFERGDNKTRQKIFNFYLKNTSYINNWDLVDLSANKIIGSHLLNKKTDILFKLARSKNLWPRRIAIVSTFQFIKKNKFGPTIKLAKILLKDKHDLIHKATGWMLREVGKRDKKTLIKFLTQNLAKIPRTSLRYAIERWSESERQIWLKK